jgi:hypothetical protein
VKLEYLGDGSDDCPLIRLYEFDRAEAMWLREIFDSLANGSRQHLSLHDEVKIEAVGGCQLGCCGWAGGKLEYRRPKECGSSARLTLRDGVMSLR